MWGQTAQRNASIRRVASGGGSCLAAGAMILALGGCGAAVASQEQISQRAPAAPAESTTDSAAENASPEATSDAVAAVTEALNSVAARTPTPDAEALQTAFESAGVDPAAVEVSIDTTPTGLEVDAMTAAVPIGGSCIFGHIREGAATVTELPMLANGQCFIGDQR